MDFLVQRNFTLTFLKKYIKALLKHLIFMWFYAIKKNMLKYLLKSALPSGHRIKVIWLIHTCLGVILFLEGNNSQVYRTLHHLHLIFITLLITYHSLQKNVIFNKLYTINNCACCQRTVSVLMLSQTHISEINNKNFKYCSYMYCLQLSTQQNKKEFGNNFESTMMSY